jgi:hypothetical protein
MREHREREQATSYENLFRALMSKPIPREVVVFSERPLDLLRHGDEEGDPYVRWLAGRSGRRLST